MSQHIIYSNQVDATLSAVIEGGNYHNVEVLVDQNTRQHVLPMLASSLEKAMVIEIPAGDEHKTLNSLISVWEALESCGATRQSLLVNLGGGMVTDLGGLAAATFKRGIACVNVPTTLLGAVDAAVGGKTGINFMGLKNEIGTFAPARHVIISTCFFSTLQHEDILSGYAEMLKHAMLNSRHEFTALLNQDLNATDSDHLLERLKASVKIKEDIVNKDPTEQGLRKALNLGHTVGHALESHALETGSPVAHGYAVAWGLVVETVLSHMILGFPSDDLYALASFVKQNYGAPSVTCEHYDRLIALMRHDKKSAAGEINCTLLRQCGEPTINNKIDVDSLQSALDIMRDLLGV